MDTRTDIGPFKADNIERRHCMSNTPARLDSIGQINVLLSRPVEYSLATDSHLPIHYLGYDD